MFRMFVSDTHYYILYDALAELHYVPSASQDLELRPGACREIKPLTTQRGSVRNGQPGNSK